MDLGRAWLAFRNRCLTSAKFHDFALRFPLTRPIVRKRQSEVFDIVSGFVYSQVLVACVELDLLSMPSLKEEGADLEALAGYCELPLDETRRLADAAASLRILQKTASGYLLGDLGAALSVSEGALAMIRHHHLLYTDMIDPVDMLRSGRRETHLSRYWDYARSLDPKSASPEEISQYSDLMSASQHDVAREVLASFDFAPYRSMLDVGGGQGTFAGHVQSATPGLKLAVFDLPEVAEKGRALQAAHPKAGDIVFHGGSFFDDPLPQGHDLMTLIRIVHDHDDEPVRQLLAAIHAALEPKGALLVAEPMSSGGHAGRISDAYFNFYLYAMGSGRPRSPEEICQMLKEAGFSCAERKTTRSPFTASMILAQK